MAELSTDLIRQPFLKAVTDRLKAAFPEEGFTAETVDYKYNGFTLSVEDSRVLTRFLNGGYKASVTFGIWYSAREDTENCRYEAVNRLCAIIDYLEAIRLTLAEGYSKGSFIYRKAPALKKRDNLGGETYMAAVEMTYLKL